jgi:hypothetical protein
MTNNPDTSVSMITRGLQWAKKPRAERNGLLALKLRQVGNKLASLPFHFGMSSMFNVFCAYQPDSYSEHHEHGEFDDLYKQFSKFNESNNAGDITRLWSFILNLKQIIAENIAGDFAELGVWKGNSAAVLARIASESERRVFLFDTFEGFSRKDLKGVDEKVPQWFNDTSEALVKTVIGEYSSVCHFAKGHFPDSINETHKSRQYAAVSLDCDLYEPMKAGLAFFYPRMPRGGLFLLHDYSSVFWAGAKQAIDEFCAQQGEFTVLMPDKSGSAFIRKSK